MQLSEQLTRMFLSMGRLLQNSEGAQLSRQDYAVLVHLPTQAESSHPSGHPPTVRSRDLADRVGLDPSTMSRRLTSLAERGLITREPDPQDRRAHLLMLSPSGATALRRERARRVALVTDALEGWQERDRAELARLLAQLSDTLEDREDSR
jgi:DNA-binding MarR family transcriptional regulator